MAKFRKRSGTIPASLFRTEGDAPSVVQISINTKFLDISCTWEGKNVWDLFRSRYASITLKLEIDVRVPAPFAGTRNRRVSKRRPKYKLYLEKILPYTIKYNRVVLPLRLTRDTRVSYRIAQTRRNRLPPCPPRTRTLFFCPPLIENYCQRLRCTFFSYARFSVSTLCARTLNLLRQDKARFREITSIRQIKYRLKCAIYVQLENAFNYIFPTLHTYIYDYSFASSRIT